MLKRIAILSIPLAACVEAEDDVELLAAEPPAEVRLDGESRAPLFGVLEYGVGWDKDYLEICWEESAYTDDPETTETDEVPLKANGREWVRNAVLGEWGNVSRIRFNRSPWEPCAYVPNADIRIGHDGVDGWSMLGIHARDIASGPTMAINLISPTNATCIPTGPSGGSGGGSIPLCNGTSVGADPQDEMHWVRAVTLHVFGYALGLHREDAHPDGEACSSAVPLEGLDDWGDREPLWQYDSLSVMRSCRMNSLAYGNVLPRLSVGDIRSINSLYPGQVRLFPDAELGGEPIVLGPGYYQNSATLDLNEVSSMVVPPGYRVLVCTTQRCAAYWESQRLLSDFYNNQIVNVTISLYSNVADGRGFIGANQWLATGTYRASQGQLNVVGDNRISSAWVPPGQAATLCDSETDPSSCIVTVGGTLGWAALVKYPGRPQPAPGVSGWGVDNTASYVKVTPRVVTHDSNDARVSPGTSYSLGVGVFTVSGGSTYVSSVTSLSVPSGLEATVCNKENLYGFPKPLCQNFKQSGAVNAALVGQIKRIDVFVPQVNAPP